MTENQRALVQEFGRKYDIARFRFRFRKTIDIICAHRLPVVEFGGFDVEVDSYCFLQATTKSDKILADYVLKFFANFSALDLKVADLFCGRGTYTIPLSAHYIVDGFESDQKALSALGDVVQTHGLNITLSHRDLFTNPLTFNELAKYNKIVINPPRSGAELQVRELSKSTVSEICYISCNPNSFTRDAKILIDAGYKLETLVPFDQFYYASHLEVIGYFVKCK